MMLDLLDQDAIFIHISMAASGKETKVGGLAIEDYGRTIENAGKVANKLEVTRPWLTADGNVPRGVMLVHEAARSCEKLLWLRDEEEAEIADISHTPHHIGWRTAVTILILAQPSERCFNPRCGHNSPIA